MRRLVRFLRRALFAFAAVACMGAAHAGEAVPTTADPVLEARVVKLAEELRCLVCQNQSLAESHAGLALDLKNEVREMLGKGMSDRDAIDFLVQRYGDFVLYRPPVNRTTWLLWAGPFVLLIAALAAFFVRLRKRTPSAPLTAEERAAAAVLLHRQGKRP
jgi:cytochrome c-type biogenesis protein CcmH